MGIAEVARQLDGTANNWDSVTALKQQEQSESRPSQQKPKRRINLWGHRGRTETAPPVSAQETPVETTVEAVDEEEDYDSEIFLDEDQYGFDEGHQQAELDYETSTLEYQLLHYSWKPQQRREMLAQLPEDSRERVKFVDSNIDIFKNCPSTGRSFTQAEAFALYRDYQEHVAGLDPDRVPSSKVGVLLEMEEMLENKRAAAMQAGDEKQARICENAFTMISDLETSESLDDYYEMTETHRDRGSQIAMSRYIKNKIDTEGYCGTKEMREHNPPIEGGALRIERNMRILHSLLPREMTEGTTTDGRTATEENPILVDIPIGDIYSELDRVDYTEDDWNFIESFSRRGKELHDYVSALQEAQKDRSNRDAYRERAEEYDKAIEWLRSDTPTDELPDQIIDMLLTEKLNSRQIAGRFYRAETSTRKQIELLSGDSELPPALQQALEKSGQSRADYAATLEAKANDLHQKALAAYQGKMTDEQRAAASKLLITREELAKRQEESRDTLLESAKTANYQYEAVKHMFRRTREDFSREVLLSETTGAPEIPEDVLDYLYSNYGRDISALKVMTNKTDSKTFHVDRLCRLRETVRRAAIYDERYAKYQKSKFGDQFGYDFDTGAAEVDPSGPYREESQFLSEKVLPVIDQLITWRGGQVPYDKEEQNARRAAEVNNGAAQDEELPAAA